MRVILWAVGLIATAWGIVRALTGHLSEAGFWLAMAFALFGWAIAEGEVVALERKIQRWDR